MKVLRDTPDRLVLDDRPLALGVMLTLAILLTAGIGLAMLASGSSGAGLMMLAGSAVWGIPFAVFVERTTAIFDRAAGTMTLRRRNALRQTEQTLRLSDIRRVLLQTSRVKKTTVYRVALGTAGKTVTPLREAYAGGKDARTAADTAARWLGLPAPGP